MLESFAIWAFFVISEDQNIFNIEKKLSTFDYEGKLN